MYPYEEEAIIAAKHGLSLEDDYFERDDDWEIDREGDFEGDWDAPTGGTAQ